MRALFYQPDQDEKVKVKKIKKPELSSGEALVKIHAAALNHRDQWIREGKYPNLKPGILGSDGCGTVIEVGDEKNKSWIDKKVVIFPSLHWGDDPKAQGKKFEVLGMPTNGTLAEYIKIPVDHLFEKPGHLKDEQAAALPLGGLTAYRAVVTHGHIQKNQASLVTGTGGGVAQMAVQIARALGADVYVTSGHDKKIKRAKQIGAKGGVNYKKKDWHKKLKEETGGFEVVIDSACGDQMNQLIDLLRPGGKLIFYGATLGMPEKLHVFKIFWKQLTIQGTTMGTVDDFSNMLDLVNRHKIVPVIDSVKPLDKVLESFEKMKTGKQVGKLVVKM